LAVLTIRVMINQFLGTLAWLRLLSRYFQ